MSHKPCCTDQWSILSGLIPIERHPTQEDYVLVTNKEKELIDRGELVVINGCMVASKAQYDTILKAREDFLLDLAMDDNQEKITDPVIQVS